MMSFLSSQGMLQAGTDRDVPLSASRRMRGLSHPDREGRVRGDSGTECVGGRGWVTIRHLAEKKWGRSRIQSHRSFHSIALPRRPHYSTSSSIASLPHPWLINARDRRSRVGQVEADPRLVSSTTANRSSVRRRRSFGW